MQIYETILWVFALWTLTEGSLVVFFPNFSIHLTRKLFPKWSEVLQGMPPAHLRQLGLIELGFGLLLALYLIFFT